MTRRNRFVQLTRLIREPASGTSIDDEAWVDLIHLLRASDLLGTLYYLADTEGVLENYSPYARRHLKSMRAFSDRQARQALYECTEIDVQLASEGIKPVFLKGAGYTLRGSRNGFGRIYSDIDALVHREDIYRAQAALKRDAWYSPPITDYDERYYRKWAHEIPPMKHLFRRTVIDLHHNIVPPISGRAPNISSLLEDLVTTKDGLHVLSPPAATLHSMVHLFTNEDFTNGFRDLVDLYLLMEEYGDESYWRDLLALARRTGFVSELVFAIASLELVLEYQVPEYVGRELKESAGKQARGFWTTKVFSRALRPHHPLLCGPVEHCAIQLTYLRGHWIKMPFPVLAGHLTVKAGMGLWAKLFGEQHAKQPLVVPTDNADTDRA
ncbi:MAG: nucleotidyltransferase family protein [Gammaproteobacteria bacterium]|jgi:hypothetical protein